MHKYAFGGRMAKTKQSKKTAARFVVYPRPEEFALSVERANAEGFRTPHLWLASVMRRALVTDTAFAGVADKFYTPGERATRVRSK